jgi:hypothetical protein
MFKNKICNSLSRTSYKYSTAMLCVWKL